MKYLPLIGTLKMPFIKNKKLHICSTRCMDVSAKIISRSDPNLDFHAHIEALDLGQILK